MSIVDDVFYAGQARKLAAAVTPLLPYTFRDGKVLVTINAVEQDGHRFSVLDATATFDGTLVELDLPLHFLNATTDSSNSIVDVHSHVSNAVRHTVAATDAATDQAG